MSKQTINLIGIVSSTLIIIGCLTPWMKFGTYGESGLQNEDGIILLIVSALSLVILLVTRKRSNKKLNWVSLATGFLGILIITLYVYDLNESQKEFNKQMDVINQFLNGQERESTINLLGIGAYLILIGSIGHLLKGFNILKNKSNFGID